MDVLAKGLFSMMLAHNRRKMGKVTAVENSSKELFHRCQNI